MKILKKSKSKNTKMDDMWLVSAGKDHFWMNWRFNFLIKQMKLNKIYLKKNLKIMDLGCGNGILSNQLESIFNLKIDRVDSNEDSLLLNKKVKGNLICYNVSTKLRKLKNFYDVIFLFDVIEHVKKDVNFLKDALYHLKKGGLLIINVPSIPSLFSKYDYAVGHLRRYNVKDFKIIKNKVNIKLISVNYWGFLMLPVLLIRKIMLSFYKKSNSKKLIKKGWKTNKLLNVFFKILMLIELKLFTNPLLGTSLMVFLRK